MGQPTINVEVCVPECHFPGTGYFPKKFGKFLVPSIREHPLPGPGPVPAFGTGCFPVSFESGNIREFPNTSIIKSKKFIRRNLGTGTGTELVRKNIINGTKQEKSWLVLFLEVFQEKSRNSVLLGNFPNGIE